MSRFKLNFQPLLLIVLVGLLSNSCKKDKLTGDLEVFKGRYTWTHTISKPNWWSSSTVTIDPANEGYTAEVEFTNTGKIIFYINNEEIHKTGYKIEQQELTGNSYWIKIDPSNEDSSLDLNNSVDFTISGDTLTVDDFPGASYDGNLGGTNYFLRN